MAGAPYDAGGIRATVAATRAASDAELRRTLARLRRRGAARQGTTTIECKSGYGLTVADEARSLRLAGELTAGDDVPRRPRGARRSTRTARRLRRAGLRRRCSTPARRTRAGSTCSASGGAFDGDQCRDGPDGRARRRARPARARQPARPRPRRRSSPSSSAPPSATTAPTSPTPTSTRSRAPARSRRCCPAPSSPPARPTPTPRRLLDAGVTVALATDCNPGLELHHHACRSASRSPSARWA